MSHHNTKLGFLDEKQTEQFLDMINDGNLTTHIYDEATAQAIYSRLPAFQKLLGALISQIQNALS